MTAQQERARRSRESATRLVDLCRVAVWLTSVYARSKVDAGGTVDLGEIAAQYLGLEINPYPTSPDAKLNLPSSGSGEDA
jgi:hypothetical protein